MDHSAPAKPRAAASKLVELALAIAIVAGFIDLVYKVLHYGYIPLPFVYDVTDTFMDWFNPSYYAHNGGAYSVYISVYAPLSFAIQEVLGTPGCYSFAPKDARSCDVVGIVSIFCFYGASALLAGLAFYRRDRSTALYRTIAFGLGLPLLYALERGNLVMIAFVFFIPFFGGLTTSKRGLAGAAAMMINLKSYLLFPILSLALKREWRLLELCGFATVGLYCVTLAIVGGGTPFELVNNLGVWFSAMSSIVWDQISYTTTYIPFLQFDAHQYPVRDFVPDKIVTAVTIFIQTEVPLSRLLCIACIILSWLYPRTISTHRLAFFMLMQSFIKDNPGGYAECFLVFLVLLETWDNSRIGWAIVAAYLISIPTDFIFATALYVTRDSWITSRTVETVYGITSGALVRPALILVILWSLGIDSLIAFHRAMRLQRPMLRVADRIAARAA